MEDFTPWKLGSIKRSKHGFGACTDTFSWYFFQLIVLLKLDFNFSSNLILSWVDKVTTGTYSYVSVIANVVAFVSLDNTHLLDQVKMRLISQLIKDISRILQKLLKYFNGTIISTFSVLQSAVLPVIFCLNLNEWLLLAAWKLAINSNESVQVSLSL